MARATVTVGGWSWLGVDYRAGDAIDAPEPLIRRWAADGYVTVASAAAPALAPRTEPAPRPAAEPVVEAGAGAEPETWRHKMDPNNYLKRFPTGPDADLARRLTEGE